LKVQAEFPEVQERLREEQHHGRKDELRRPHFINTIRSVAERPSPLK